MPSLALAALAMTVAARRGPVVTRSCRGAAIAAAGLVAAMTEVGYAGNPRYLVPVSAALVSWAAWAWRASRGRPGRRPRVRRAGATTPPSAP